MNILQQVEEAKSQFVSKNGREPEEIRGRGFQPQSWTIQKAPPPKNRSEFDLGKWFCRPNFQGAVSWWNWASSRNPVDRFFFVTQHARDCGWKPQPRTATNELLLSWPATSSGTAIE